MQVRDMGNKERSDENFLSRSFLISTFGTEDTTAEGGTSDYEDNEEDEEQNKTDVHDDLAINVVLLISLI